MYPHRGHLEQLRNPAAQGRARLLVEHQTPVIVAHRLELLPNQRVVAVGEGLRQLSVGRRIHLLPLVGELSRRKIEDLVGRRAYLELRVKVIPGWRRKRDKLKQLGFPGPDAR